MSNEIQTDIKLKDRKKERKKVHIVCENEKKV